MKIVKISIISPDTDKPVSVEEWKNDPDPSRAKWVLIETDELKPFRLYKHSAQSAPVCPPEDGEFPSLAQAFAVAVAMHNGLTGVVDLIGGNISAELIWTKEDSVLKKTFGNSLIWRYGLDLYSGDVGAHPFALDGGYDYIFVK